MTTQKYYMPRNHLTNLNRPGKAGMETNKMTDRITHKKDNAR